MKRSAVPAQTASVRWALVSLALSMLLSSMGVSIANVALPTLVLAFTTTFQEVQWIVIAYLLAITIMVVSVGRLGDLVGHRRVLLVGLFLFTTASVLCGVAPTLWMLIGARAIQGIGAAILMAVTVALVRETVPTERTGGAMGLLGTMSAIGTALGPSFGGILIAGPGWRAMFLVMVPLGILAFFLAHRHVTAHQASINNQRARLDGAGTFLLGLALAAYALSMTVGGSRFDRFNMILLLAAGLGTALFLIVESKATSPLIRLATFRNAALNASLIANALVADVMMTTLVVGPFYLAIGLGLSEALVGLVLSIGPIISALSGVPAGRIVDRLGAPQIVVAGLVALAAGAFGLVMLPQSLGIVGYIMAIAILTPGYQLFQAANNTAVMMDVSTDQRGVLSGMLGLSRNLGLITGASAMGAVFSFASGTSDFTTVSPEAVANGMQTTFAVAGGLMVIALGVALGSRAFAASADQKAGRADRMLGVTASVRETQKRSAPDSKRS